MWFEDGIAHAHHPNVFDEHEVMLPGNLRRQPVVDSRLDLVGALPSVSNNPTPRRGKPCSDHAPVTAVFEI